MNQIYLIFGGVGVPSLAILSIYPPSTRFILLFLPVVIIWASNGVVQLSRWAGATMRLAGFGAPSSIRARMSVGLTASAMLILIALLSVGNVWELRFSDYESRPVKQAGKWLDALLPGPKTVMDASPYVAFHAGASYVPFPFSDESLALKYIEKKRVEFIVLREDFSSSAPYWKNWFEDGIPDQRAQLIYREKMPLRGRILIYKWNGKTAEP